jgi:phenylalanyl-tRNA synthetase alpha chain
MSYTNPKIAEAAELLKTKFAELSDKQAILRAPELRALYGQIKDQPAETKAAFGAEINALKQELEALIKNAQNDQDDRQPFDVTAPFDVNTSLKPTTGFAVDGSTHPLTQEIETIVDIFHRMGFTALESRQIDDDFHMFETLNFPEGHPARDDWDTFMTTEGLIAPAHTSTMQHRALTMYKDNLKNGEPIAVVMPGRVFRNEDLDATHEHTFHQFEGVYVSKGVTVGNLIATLKAYMNEFFGQEIVAKIQPFYFPFTEPSFEFLIERPDSLKKDDSEAEKWLEIAGCGLIHPNVLKMAGIDPNEFTGFAFGFGIERMVMMKNNIEDVRHFESGKLEFLRQF